MPLVHIIPYVADQFDPGLFVFDGGTFQSGEAFVEKSGRSYPVFKDETFNLSDVFKGNYQNLGIHVFDKVQLRKSSVFKSVALFYFTGATVNYGFAHEVPLVLVAEEPTVVFGFAHENNDKNVYTSVIKDQVQNKVSKAQNVPYVLDAETQFDPEVPEDTGFASSETLVRLGYADLQFDAASITPKSDAQFLRILKAAPTFEGVAAAVKPMVAVQNTNEPVTTRDMYTIAEIPETSES